MRLILRPFILFFLFIFAYSSQVATLNIYTNHNDNNICKSDEKNNNLECISHCCLTQFDNFIYSPIFFSSYEQINKNVNVFYLFSNYITFVEARFNSPPIII